MLDTAMATADAQVSIQVSDHLGQPGVMGGQHGSAGGRVTETVEDRDALGRTQDQVERWDGVAAVGAAEQIPGRRVPALKHGLEPGHRSFALQPSALAPAPYHRPGLSPWPDRYARWSVASSRVE